MGVNTLWLSSPVLGTKLCEMGAGANVGSLPVRVPLVLPHRERVDVRLGERPALHGRRHHQPHRAALRRGGRSGRARERGAPARHPRPHRPGRQPRLRRPGAAERAGAADRARSRPRTRPTWPGSTSPTAAASTTAATRTSGTRPRRRRGTAPTAGSTRTCRTSTRRTRRSTTRVANHAVWLMEQFNLDGFRVDAVKQVNNDLCLDMRSKIDAAISTNLPFYMVGEALGGVVANVMDCVNPSMFNGSMDDPLHNTIVGTILSERLERGNGPRQRRPVRRGDVDRRDAGRPHGPLLRQPRHGARHQHRGGRRRRRPVDEPAAGAGDQRRRVQPPAARARVPAHVRLDPHRLDGRRVRAARRDRSRLPAHDAVRLRARARSEQATLANFQKLGKVRAAHPALREGNAHAALGRLRRSTRTAASTGSDIVVAAFNFGSSQASRTMSVTNIGLTGTVTDALSGATATVSGGALTITLPALTAAVFTP